MDPCFAPTSCECICQRYDALAGDCGPEAEQICTLDCPDDTWPEVDGTPSCACTAELEMTIGETTRTHP
ncbi:MAG: hypothetical protein JXR76_18945 [Deltaproteobacteria bacterium]|nr:hypothetical protein [Deltaproteobacteria bacterium]